MSSLFSCEEKCCVMTYVATHGLNGGPLEDEKDWKNLAEDMGRDWEEVRDAYRSWKMEIDVGLPTKTEQAYEPQEGACVQYNLESYEIQNLKNNNDGDEIQYVFIEGEAVDAQELEQLLENSSQAREEMIEQGLMQVGKRKLDLNDFDFKLLRTFEARSREELELKREEHAQKMKIYQMQLENCKEIHKEKMKILKTKLVEVQQKVHHIDHVICNKKLNRRFKSGPI